MDDFKEDVKKAEKITAIITDLDNTLWKGILAEKQNLKLNKDYYEFLKSLCKKGIQLFVVSKNDESDVLSSFRKLGIDKEIFTYVISNWDAKYLNIDKLITSSQLRPETVIFIDDNPLERNEVKAKISKVYCIDALNWEVLKEVIYLNKRKEQTASEITTRINRYRTSIISNELKSKYEEEDIDFYRSLKRELSMGLMDADNLNRFARLFVETHRINFNPEKFMVYDETLDYLYERLNKGDRLYAISTRENNISLGLTGCLVVHIEKDKAQLIDGTFSCGIIGRDFEQKAILHLIDILKKEGFRELEIFITLTSSNKRVREIFEHLGLHEKERKENELIYSINLRNYKPTKEYEWISVLKTPPELEYIGHPFVTNFFNENVKPLIKESFSIINLGAGKGEVWGHMEKEEREKFYNFLKEKKIRYTKIDVEYYPSEENIVANAENLGNIIKTESGDLVLALELLEHTEHFWKIINEMIRICKVGGYIFITVPSFYYPKHEYPIDLWRIGPETLKSFFDEPYFKIIKLVTEGKKETPRRSMILVKKLKKIEPNYEMPKEGKINWETGLTIFS